MIKDVLKYLQPNAVIPIDMETTIMLVNALKEALAQPEQEPVGVVNIGDGGNWYFLPLVPTSELPEGTKFYTHPPQRTEPAQQKKVWTFWDLSGGDITDAIAAKLKEKNT